MASAQLDRLNVWAKAQAAPPEGQVKDPVLGAYEAWRQAPSPASAGQMLQQLAPTIDSALTSYAPAERDALATRAKLIALKAAGTYDPKQRTKLSSHVFNNLKSLNREKARRGHVVHIPENVLLERNKLGQVRKELEEDRGSEPTVEELADHMGLSPRRIERIEAAGAQVSASQSLTEKGDSLFSKAEDPQRIWSDYIYHDLDGPDKKIFEWSTGYGGTKRIPKLEIAKRLKISPSAVSQRIGRIVGRLEEGYSV